jgi:DNA-binding CsgD family transcriptional regulator
MNAYQIEFDSHKSLLFLRMATAGGEVLASLRPAEREIAELLVAGCSNAEIAQRRGTSPRTVANQIARIFETLGVSSRVQLARRLALGA